MKKSSLSQRGQLWKRTLYHVVIVTLISFPKVCDGLMIVKLSLCHLLRVTPALHFKGLNLCHCPHTLLLSLEFDFECSRTLVFGDSLTSQ